MTGNPQKNPFLTCKTHQMKNKTPIFKKSTIQIKKEETIKVSIQP